MSPRTRALGGGSIAAPAVDYTGVDSHDPGPQRLRFLLAALGEPPASTDTERLLVVVYERLWPLRKADDRAEPFGEQIGP